MATVARIKKGMQVRPPYHIYIHTYICRYAPPTIYICTYILIYIYTCIYIWGS